MVSPSINPAPGSGRTDLERRKPRRRRIFPETDGESDHCADCAESSAQDRHESSVVPREAG
ncbi:hypothetical protein [Dermacoccus sp. 147Ba]|uniref:hypothetical protein n=1 Tax=Dermacoccus sp. 147Ba TaxID=2510111 RepID=UPI00101D5F26|nr:hypothetical protein [Dermacoccus sp. 147Ba]